MKSRLTFQFLTLNQGIHELFSSKVYEELSLKRIVALREAKNKEYIADIDEEMEKYKNRVLALDEYQLIIAEKKVCSNRTYFHYIYGTMFSYVP